MQFADGTSWTGQQVITLSTVGTTGNTQGTVFDSGGTTHYEQGNGNGDTFVFNQGYGFLQVRDNGLGTNVLQLGAGIAASDIQVTSDGTSVYLTIGSNGDRVQLDYMLSNPGYGVEAVRFADGTSWSGQQVIALSTVGTTGNDNLYGTGQPTVFDGKGGSDYEQGGGNGDTFVFDQGYGQLKVRDNGPGTNVLQLGAGIAASDIQVTSDGTSVYLTIGSNGDRVQLDYMLSNPGYGVEAVRFADGTSWSGQQVIALSTVGTTGNDNLYGTGQPTVFDGKGGSDYEQGGGNGDTFVFDQGYGQLKVRDNGPGTNVLQLGAGIAASDVTVTSDGTSIQLAIGGNGDHVQLDYMLSNPGYGVETVQFADGTSWSKSQLTFLSQHGTAGSDTIIGTTGNDILDGRGGGDTLIGNGGNDTYLFKSGYGQLVIQNTNPVGIAPSGQLDLGTGLTENNLWFSQVGNDLYIQAIGSKDLVDIKGWFNPDSPGSLARIIGGDGLSMDNGVGQLVSAMASYQATHPGFNAAFAGAMPNDSSVKSALAAAWHH